MNRRLFLLGLLLTSSAIIPALDAKSAELLNGSSRGAKNGWITVQLAGTPQAIGYQHGYLLAPEIADALKVTKLNMLHDSKKDWTFFRNVAQTVLWPNIEEEYRLELTGIAEGATAHGVKIDVWDVVVLNASIELGYYTAWLDKQKRSAAPDKCSAFVATGSFTRDGKIVIGHNNWSGYLEGARWNIVFDIRPAKGYRIVMDGFPGFIHSGDDFGVNSAGIVITETTITQFRGFDPKGIAEFVRARKAMQYSASIDDFDRIMRAGNNGGYANTWLVADINTNEIAQLELGLKNVTLQRKKDGYFVGANFPINPKLTSEETDFPINDLALSPNARHKRWEQLMKESKGAIDVAAGKKFLSDHYDAYANKNEPNERTLCGHNEVSPRGLEPWMPPYGPAGAVQSKVTDARMAKQMSFEAAAGHACGINFKAAEHLKKHPEFAWQKGLLRDLISSPWTKF